jgi:hypothetical protein
MDFPRDLETTENQLNMKEKQIACLQENKYSISPEYSLLLLLKHT